MMARFCRYLDKVFDLGALLAQLRDARRKPQIPTKAVFLCALLMAATRLASLNALEGQLRRGGPWRRLVGRRLPSADSLGRIVGQIAPALLRDMLAGVNHRLRRKKMLEDNPWALRVVVLDGHEFFSQ
jgi:hypothetical protein